MIETKHARIREGRERVILLVLWVLLLILAVFATTVATADTDTDTDTGLSEAIRVLVRNNPPHPLNNRHARAEFAEWVEDAGRLYAVPPALVLSTAFVESSLWARSPGKIGEIGLMQVPGSATKHCNLRTPQGQLECGAKWLDECRHVCGTWKGAITAYMLGSCQTGNISVIKSVEYRMRHWAKVERISQCPTD